MDGFSSQGLSPIIILNRRGELKPDYSFVRFIRSVRIQIFQVVLDKMAEETSTRSRSEADDSTDSRQKESIDSREEEAFNYDDILEHVGQIGKYQLHTFLWLCLPAFFPGIIVMSYTFTGAVPNYR